MRLFFDESFAGNRQRRKEFDSFDIDGFVRERIAISGEYFGNFMQKRPSLSRNATDTEAITFFDCVMNQRTICYAMKKNGNCTPVGD